MKTVKVSKKGYERLWNRIKQNIRVIPTQLPLHPYMSEEERKEVFREAFDPSMPSRIVLHSTKGQFEVVCTA